MPTSFSAMSLTPRSIPAQHSFFPFQNLPTEIRLTIWRVTLSARHPVTEIRVNYWDAGPTNPPAVLQVNQESRQEARRVLDEFRLNEPKDGFHIKATSAYFDLSRAIFYLRVGWLGGARTLDAQDYYKHDVALLLTVFAESMNHDQRSSVQHLAIDFPHRRGYCFASYVASKLARFNGLKNLILVSGVQRPQFLKLGNRVLVHSQHSLPEFEGEVRSALFEAFGFEEGRKYEPPNIEVIEWEGELSLCDADCGCESGNQQELRLRTELDGKDQRETSFGNNTRGI
jgi:hypothetical protein